MALAFNVTHRNSCLDQNLLTNQMTNKMTGKCCSDDFRALGVKMRSIRIDRYKSQLVTVSYCEMDEAKNKDNVE
ncbi:hypothetical protein T4D_1673 [Trichinella pseudospiralis]|uniref:Uncharacterized protein n=1 Tax=Trichinella pseudospiralis TaxID=6337 RepID=A0A0V1G415_TRIPS|nr:hypothetical protein T4D_1673 [Trichinella pseudospiralis]